jgi:hypothetical protein
MDGGHPPQREARDMACADTQRVQQCDRIAGHLLDIKIVVRSLGLSYAARVVTDRLEMARVTLDLRRPARTIEASARY